VFDKLEDLLRRADWEGLSEAQRGELASGLRLPTTLAARFGVPSGPTASVPLGAPVGDSDLQDWVAQVVAPRLQPEAAAVIAGWLANPAADGHLYVGGRPGQGRTSLVASLARQAMAQRPAPPEYCFVPTPSDLTRPRALALPRGTSAAFGKTLGQALSAIAQGWDDARSATPEGDAPPPLRALVATQFDPLVAAAPASARDYLSQLRAAWDALASAGASLAFGGDDLPVAHIEPAPDIPAGAAADQGAPVVVVPLANTQMSDDLLRANGGVLILNASEIGQSDWNILAIALKARALTLKAGLPAIPLAVRVVFIGAGDTYDALNNNSEDFARLVRHEVWCSGLVDWTPESEASYAALVNGVARYYDLPPFDPSGVGRFVEEGARRVSVLNRSFLSTDLLLLRDLAVAAGREAQARQTPATSGAQVEEALRQRRVLQGVNARRTLQAILSGQEITPTAGTAIGQINGLGVYEFHPSEGNFSTPMRISATVTPGREEQLIDVEHEAAQADADHVRGALTMEGFLARRYGLTQPISAVIRIRFEQEHGATGGDSASVAILFALLSALSQVPIRNSLAVTGAVGQYGEIQPIGSVNTKIEGFWTLCRLRHAQGEQPPGGYGVLIPAVNARDLMLRAEVAQSIVSEGWFHVIPISSVDEGLLYLTGVAAATIHTRAEQQLQRFHALATGGRGGR
jgi:hypothetical protein